ncbi:nuclear transport factor 2 family protein [Mycobacterium sp. MYCO198283]|uniref:nuclear transport factor 2 family protein n=1 Tax=Mycobacterium sp. MYCO198283 TaxID=2883505 RepID=UPI001E5BBFE2|nr:nuclear transport factor 2 family protein [Mycobacterium sp. MYCO198283]MCG5430873.1 nuclear transport factor 2 family protein [Mycobacterium sp. MYCO198283]
MTAVDPAAIVTRYLEVVSGGTAEQVAALYAEDATLEDPVGGGEVHIGRQAIAGFYQAITGAEISTELLELRVGGHEAAFLFAITVGAGEHRMRIEPIEVMVFDERGQIASMKAYWSPENVTQL